MKFTHFSNNDESSHANQESQQIKQGNDAPSLQSGQSSTKANWAKLADELDVVDPSDHSAWDVKPSYSGASSSFDEYPQIGDCDSSDGIVWDADELSQRQAGNRQSRSNDVYEHSSNETNKIDEDYETRSRNRTHSVWNRGEWSVKEKRDYQDYGNGAKDARQERFGDRGNGDRRYVGNGFQRDRGFDYNDSRNGGRPNSYRSDYQTGGRSTGRQGYRNDRAPFAQGPDDRRQPQDGGQGYRNGGNFRPNNFRNDGQYLPSGDRNNNRYNDRRDFRRTPNEFHPNYNAPSNGYYRREPDEYASDNRRYYSGYGQSDSNGWRKNDYSGNYYGGDRRRSRFGRRENLEPTIGALGKRGEPLSLAEELAAQRVKRNGTDNALDANGKSQNASKDPSTTENAQRANVSYGDRTPLEIVELEKMSMTELVAEARRQDLKTIEGEQRRDLLNRVLRARIQQNGMMFGEGTLEILPDEFGFLRSFDANYVSCPDDIYISPSQIRRFGLRNGLVISGQIRPPKERERYFALLRVESINGENPNLLASKVFFDDLVVARPVKQLKLEPQHEFPVEENNESQEQIQRLCHSNLRAIDVLTPIAFGQRALVVCPSHAGRTDFIRGLVQSVITNNPEAFVFVLLVDKRPEEITEARRCLKSNHSEVVGSTFDETPVRHIQISEIVFEKAKRMVEYGQDVIIVMDSLTRLVRAWNADRFSPENPYTETLDQISLQRPKRLFSSARRIDGGGSLTVVAAIQPDEANPADQQILTEFKEVANAGIWLDRDLYESKAPISISASKSFVRDVKDFFNDEEYPLLLQFQDKIAKLDPQECDQFFAQKIGETTNNTELLRSIN